MYIPVLPCKKACQFPSIAFSVVACFVEVWVMLWQLVIFVFLFSLRHLDFFEMVRNEDDLELAKRFDLVRFSVKYLNLPKLNILFGSLMQLPFYISWKQQLALMLRLASPLFFTVFHLAYGVSGETKIIITDRHSENCLWQRFLFLCFAECSGAEDAINTVLTFAVLQSWWSRWFYFQASPLQDFEFFTGLGLISDTFSSISQETLLMTVTPEAMERRQYFKMDGI